MTREQLLQLQQAYFDAELAVLQEIHHPERTVNDDGKPRGYSPGAKGD